MFQIDDANKKNTVRPASFQGFFTNAVMIYGFVLYELLFDILWYYLGGERPLTHINLCSWCVKQTIFKPDSRVGSLEHKSNVTVHISGMEIEMRTPGHRVQGEALPYSILDFQNRMLRHESNSNIDLNIHLVLKLNSYFAWIIIIYSLT